MSKIHYMKDIPNFRMRDGSIQDIKAITCNTTFSPNTADWMCAVDPEDVTCDRCKQTNAYRAAIAKTQ